MQANWVPEMNCFNHRSEGAVGICKSCGKGLCPACATEVPNGIACRDSCEDRVNLLNRIIDANSKTLAIANKQMRSGAILLLSLGLCLLATAGLSIAAHDLFFAMFIGTSGLLFVIYGLARLLSRGYPNLQQESFENEPRDGFGRHSA